MKLTINGIEIPVETDPAIAVFCELDSDETIGPIEIWLRGGALTIRGTDHHPHSVDVHGTGHDPTRAWLIFQAADWEATGNRWTI